MKFKLVSIAVAAALMGCGGGSGSSDDKPQPPKPTIPDAETIAAMSDSFGFDVTTICSDTNFICYVDEGTEEQRSTVAAVIETKDMLMSSDTYDGEFYNYSDLVYPTIEGYADYAEPVKATTELTITVDGEIVQNLTFDTAARDIDLESDDNQVVIELDNSVRWVEQSELLAVLSDVTNESITLEASSTVLLSTGQTLNKLSLRKDLSSDAAKSFFTMLQLKHSELYEPEPEANKPPVIKLTGNPNTVAGEVNTSVSVTVTDPEGDKTSYMYDISNLDRTVGFDFDQEGNLTFAPAIDHKGSTSSFIISAYDEHGNTTDKVVTVVITPADQPEPENTAPTFTTQPTSINLMVGTASSVPFEVKDKENDSLTYKLKAESGVIPSWISFDAKTGAIDAAPKDNSDAGNYVFTISVTDGEHVTTSEQFTITVTVQEVVEPTLNDFANLVGEPVEKLKLLFKSNHLNWEINGSNEPLVTLGHWGWSEFTFNLATKQLTMKGEKHVADGELLTVDSLDTVTYTASARNTPAVSIPAVTHKLEIPEDYIDGSDVYAYLAEGTYTNEIVTVLLKPDTDNGASQPKVTMLFDTTNALTGVQGKSEITIDAYVLDTVYRPYLLEILTK